MDNNKKNWLIVIYFWILIISSISCQEGQYVGQIDIVILSTIVGSAFFEIKNRHTLAGICLALACYIKMSPIILIIPLLRLKKWSMLKVFILSSIIITLAIILFSPQGWRIFLDFINYLSIHTYDIQTYEGSISFPYQIAKAINSVTPLTLFIIKCVVLLFFIILTFRFRWEFEDDFLKLYSLFIFAMLLISPIVWVHHFIWLSFPFAVYASKLFIQKKYCLFFLLYLFALTPVPIAIYINSHTRALL